MAEQSSALSLSKPDGSLLSRLEAEKEIREKCKSVHRIRLLAIGAPYQLEKRLAFLLKPASIVHWLLDEMIRQRQISGEEIGVKPDLDNDEAYFTTFQQRLAAFVQNNQALMPKEGDGINMSDMNQMMPPGGAPPVNGQMAPQGFAPPPPPAFHQPQPPSAAGYNPPPPQQQMYQQPPQQGYPPQGPPPPQQGFAPPPPPQQGFAPPPGGAPPQPNYPPQGAPQQGFAPPPQQQQPAFPQQPGQPPIPQAQMPAPVPQQGAPAAAPAGGSRRRKSSADQSQAGAPPAPPQGFAPPPGGFAPPPGGAPQPGFAPPSMPNFAPPQQQQPNYQQPQGAAPQQAGDNTELLLNQQRQVLEQLRTMLDNSQKQVAANTAAIQQLTQLLRIQDVALSYVMRVFYGKPLPQNPNELGLVAAFQLIGLPLPQ